MKKKKTTTKQNYKPIYNKQNNKNIYTSAISKLKKVRLKIALKSKSKFDSL